MKIRVYRIRNVGDGNYWCYVDEKNLGDTVVSWVEGMSEDCSIEVQPQLMDEKKFNNLPEYEA